MNYLDNDVSELLWEYVQSIKNKKKHKIVLNELKDNILFTTHINYYEKYFYNYNILFYNDSHLQNMIENKNDTIKQIKKIEGKQGWILDNPSEFNWDILVISKLNFDVEDHHDNLTLKDKENHCKYRSYPPHSKHYNSKDLLKNIK